MHGCSHLDGFIINLFYHVIRRHFCTKNGGIFLLCSILWNFNYNPDKSNDFCNDIGNQVCSIHSCKLLSKSISCSRYKKLTDIGNTWYSNKELVKTSTVPMTVLLLYGITITFINSHFELRNFNIYSICLEGQNAKKNEYEMPFRFLTFILPVVLMIVTTSIMDLSSYRWLQKRDNKSLETRRGCCKEDIPLRATAVYYFLHAVFTIIFFCIFALKVTPLEKYLIVNVLVKIDNILRNPLTVVFAFKINDSTRQKNAAKERERRRNTEIQHALSRRMESIELQGKENIIDFRISN